VRVLLTRGREGSGALARRLRKEGFDVVERPLIRIEPIDGPPIRTDGYDWVILTSRIAVDRLFRRLDGPLRRVAVIGPGTADALRKHGVEPALVASESTQDGLLAELPRPAGRVLFAGAAGARDLLVRELGADFVPLYRTVEETPDTLPETDLVVLASASAARALAAVRTDLPCVSIGPATTTEAERSGLRIVSEARRHDLDGLVAAVKLAASSIASSRS
jgi:uroporphyrinogen III methyltransferase / synthase